MEEEETQTDGRVEGGQEEQMSESTLKRVTEVEEKEKRSNWPPRGLQPV